MKRKADGCECPEYSSEYSSEFSNDPSEKSKKRPDERSDVRPFDTAFKSAKEIGPKRKIAKGLDPKWSDAGFKAFTESKEYKESKNATKSRNFKNNRESDTTQTIIGATDDMAVLNALPAEFATPGKYNVRLTIMEYMGFDSFSEFEFPLVKNDVTQLLPDLSQKLFPFQTRLVRWATLDRGKNTGRVYLHAAQGLGKTLMVIVIILCLQKMNRNAFPVLVVSPAKTIPDWVQHWKTYCKVEKLPDWIVVTTSETANKRKNQDTFEKYNTIVVDEARKCLGNDETQFYKNFAHVMKKTRYLILCSGTPYDRHRDLWAQLNVLFPDVFNNRDEFMIKYCGRRLVPLYRGSTQKRYDTSSSTNDDELAATLKTVAMRYAGRHMRALLSGEDAPTINTSVTYVPLPEAPPHIVRFFAGMLSVGEVKSQLQVGEKQFLEEYNRISVFKIPEVYLFLHNHREFGREPWLVFVRHASMGDAVERVCVERDISYMRINGQTSQRDVADRIKRFQAGETKVAILSIRACATGITLTRSSQVWFAEVSWDFTEDDQARCRVLRIGQTRDVAIKYLVKKKDSFDERLLLIVHSKGVVVRKLQRVG
jgi:SWI/SNF-related matrix-associated actin-dependent regulator of chromatin subfamily A-like protein 1